MNSTDEWLLHVALDQLARAAAGHARGSCLSGR